MGKSLVSCFFLRHSVLHTFALWRGKDGSFALSECTREVMGYKISRKENERRAT